MKNIKIKKTVLILVLVSLFSCAQKYEYIGEYKDGFAFVRLNGKYGFIDTTGKVITPIKYDEVRYFSNGLALVRLEDKYGFIDKTGAEIIPLKYDGAYSFSEGAAVVRIGRNIFINYRLDGKYGFIDKTGKEITPIKYDEIRDFSGGFAIVGLEDKYGFIDKTGKEVIPIKYSFARSFTEGIAAVIVGGRVYQYDNSEVKYKGGKWILIDTSGKEIALTHNYNAVTIFSGGFASVELNDKHGFIDRNGSEVISPKYDFVGSFSEGLALVGMGFFSNGKYGYIDEKGKEIIALKYESGGQFTHGIANVSLNGKFGFVDKTGKEIISLKYDDAEFSDEGFPIVKYKEWGNNFFKINEKGQKIDDQKFSYSTHSH